MTLYMSKLSEMAERMKEPEPVSEFIRFLMERWQADGKRLNALTDAAGVAQSLASQIKARTSDATFYSASRFARPLGYRDLPHLVIAAYEWWGSKDRNQMPDVSAESPLAEATRLAQQYAVTHEQIGRVLARYPAADFADKDALWWLTKFHEERTFDLERAAVQRAETRAEEHAGKVRKRKQAETREAKQKLSAPPPSHSKRHKAAG